MVIVKLLIFDYFNFFTLDNIEKIKGTVYINASVHDDLVPFFDHFNATNFAAQQKIANEMDSDVEEQNNGISFY